MTNYKFRPIKKEIEITHLVTVHYFEYSKDFVFNGEAHNFWELLYIDKGSAIVSADEKEFELYEKEVVFHKPNEFHTVKANGIKAPNLVVVSFHSLSTAMSKFNHFKTQLNSVEIDLLTEVIQLAMTIYHNDLTDPSLSELLVKNDMATEEQLLINKLETLLLTLLCKRSTHEICKYNHLNRQNEDLTKIDNYIQNNIHTKFDLDTISKKTLLSKTQIYRLIKSKCNVTPNQYFTDKKITTAKLMIRETSLSFSEISTKLGYNSIHYFSKVFKKHMGMTLSEYAKSIKAMLKEEL